MSSNPLAIPDEPALRRSSRKAVASLILGVVGLIPYVAFLLGPAALILARSARNEIRRDPTHVSGTGLARAGLVLGLIDCVIALLVFAVLAIVFYIASGGPWRT